VRLGSAREIVLRQRLQKAMDGCRVRLRRPIHDLATPDDRARVRDPAAQYLVHGRSLIFQLTFVGEGRNQPPARA